MYKIRNGSGGALPLTLERGSIIMQPGGTVDLDGLCSRAWIRKNGQLQELLARDVIELIHDSEQGVPDQPIKPIIRNSMKQKVRDQVAAPVIVDFSRVSEDQDNLEIEDVKEDVPDEEDSQVDVPDLVIEDAVEEDSDAVIENFEDVDSEDSSEDSVKDVPENAYIDCPECGKPCKGNRGLAAHMRSHD